MKQSSKERLSTLLMDELLERLSARESIRDMLGDMTSLPIDVVIEHMLSEFEKAVKEFHGQQTRSKSEVTEKQPEPAAAEVMHEADPGETLVAVEEDQPEAVQTVEASVLPDRVEIVPVVDTMAPPVHGGTVPPEPTPEQSQEQEPPAPVDSMEPVAPVVEPKVLLDPIKLEFPKITLRVNIPEPVPPSEEQELSGPGKKSMPPVAKEEPPPQQKSDNQETKPQPPPIPQPAAKHEHHGSARKSVRSDAKDEARPRQKADDQEKELRRLEELARKIEAEYDLRSKKKAAPPPVIPAQEKAVPAHESVQPDHVRLVDPVSAGEDAEEMTDVEPAGPGKHAAHEHCTFADDEFVYVHAASKIPSGENPTPEPFMLEEKGIDGRGFAFAFDYCGMRFYLSKINPSEVNISRSMVLLLNKQESLQMQGVHESTLNDLRAHGILLPMEFGTVARGKDYLLGLVDKNREDLEEALDELEKTSWWTVTASMLDARIAGVVGTDVQQVGRERHRDRASYMSIATGKKFDIKVLERILQREKKIAEGIHAELSKIVDRSDVETMIGLGSGTSEDWKVILKASYEVPPRDLARFSRSVTDLQYHHLQYDLMLALTGNKDHIALRRK